MPEVDRWLSDDVFISPVRAIWKTPSIDSRSVTVNGALGEQGGTIRVHFDQAGWDHRHHPGRGLNVDVRGLKVEMILPLGAPIGPVGLQPATLSTLGLKPELVSPFQDRSGGEGYWNNGLGYTAQMTGSSDPCLTFSPWTPNMTWVRISFWNSPSLDRFGGN